MLQFPHPGFPGRLNMLGPLPRPMRTPGRSRVVLITAPSAGPPQGNMEDNLKHNFSREHDQRAVWPPAGNADSAMLSAPDASSQTNAESELRVCSSLSPSKSSSKGPEHDELHGPFTPSSSSAQRRKRPKYDWHGLSDDHRIFLLGSAARLLGFNRSITIRLFEEHQHLAVNSGMSLRDWSVKMVHNAIARACRASGLKPADTPYILTVEPHFHKRTKMERKAYPRDPERTFDIHAAIKAPTGEFSARIEKELRTAFYQPGYEGGRQFHFQELDDEKGGARGWVAYLMKHARETAQVHPDAVPGKAWSLSQSVTNRAKERLTELIDNLGREEALALMTDVKVYEVELGKARRAMKRQPLPLAPAVDPIEPMISPGPETIAPAADPVDDLAAQLPAMIEEYQQAMAESLAVGPGENALEVERIATAAGIAVERAQKTQEGLVAFDAEQRASHARDDSRALLSHRDAGAMSAERTALK